MDTTDWKPLQKILLKYWLLTTYFKKILSYCKITYAEKKKCLFMVLIQIYLYKKSNKHTQ